MKLNYLNKQTIASLIKFAEGALNYANSFVNNFSWKEDTVDFNVELGPADPSVGLFGESIDEVYFDGIGVTSITIEELAQFGDELFDYGEGFTLSALKNPTEGEDRIKALVHQLIKTLLVAGDLWDVILLEKIWKMGHARLPLMMDEHEYYEDILKDELKDEKMDEEYQKSGSSRYRKYKPLTDFETIRNEVEQIIQEEMNIHPIITIEGNNIIIELHITTGENQKFDTPPITFDKGR